MSRVTAIICGVLLFGLGLFLGMVGSFVRTLSLDDPPGPKAGPRAVAMTTPSKPVRKTPPSATKPPPAAVESALSQALAMVAVAMASQPAASAPPAVASADNATNSPEPHALELLMPDAVNEPPRVEAPAAEPQAAAPPPPPDPMAGHWVFDRQLGWMWLPEHTSSVVVVPVIEVFPGGLITIHAGPKAAASQASRQRAAPSQIQPRRNSVIQHDAPGSARKPATSPFPNKN